MKIFISVIVYIASLLVSILTNVAMGVVGGFAWLIFAMINGTPVGLGDFGVALCSGLIAGFIVDAVAYRKGYKERWYTWGFLFGIVALIAILVKKKSDNNEYREVLSFERFCIKFFQMSIIFLLVGLILNYAVVLKALGFVVNNYVNILFFAATGSVGGLVSALIIPWLGEINVSLIAGMIIGNIIFGFVVDKVAAIKGRKAIWYTFGFLFGFVALIIALCLKKKATAAPRVVFSAKRVSSIVLHVLLFMLLIVVFYPFLTGLFSSFKTRMEILTSPNLLPTEWQINNYIDAWYGANFGQFTLNTAWYTAATICVTVLTSTVNGYAFARGEFRGKNFIFLMFTSLMFITLGSSSLYPAMQLMKMFGLSQLGLWGLVIKGFFAIHIADMYLVRGFINQLPKELDEAATIDGCGFIGIFFRIILPLLKPMIATLAILTFSGAWNDYLWPMIVTMGNPDAQPLAVGLRALATSGDGAASWHLILAGSMISAIPMMTVYLFFNKYFVKGLASGAVKG